MEKNNNLRVGMPVFSSIFFIMGFATTFIIQLSAPLKAVFSLSEFQAQLLTSAFFVAYPIMAFPISMLVNRIGYKCTVINGLILMGLGSMVFVPAAKLPSYPLFLLATFILAVGVVFLHVTANPYVAGMGEEKSASSRLNLTQALNSIATMIAPWVIAMLIFKGLVLAHEASEAERLAYGLEVASRIPASFIALAALVFFAAISLFFIKLPELATEQGGKKGNVLKYPHVLLGALAIFCYVGSEVGNAALMTNYLRTGSLGLSAETAASYVAVYWGGAMIGRFFGSMMFSDTPVKKLLVYVPLILLLAFVSATFVTGYNWKMGAIFTLTSALNFAFMVIGKGQPSRSLAIFALAAAILGLLTTFTTGNIALWTVVSIGLFNSIMFPNIFALAVKDLKGSELASASGFVNSFVVGGAVVPAIMGSIADIYGYTFAYIVPAICYLYIMFYAIKGSKIRLKG